MPVRLSARSRALVIEMRPVRRRALLVRCRLEGPRGLRFLYAEHGNDHDEEELEPA
jgi:hypothetical protein